VLDFLGGNIGTWGSIEVAGGFLFAAGGAARAAYAVKYVCRSIGHWRGNPVRCFRSVRVNSVPQNLSYPRNGVGTNFGLVVGEARPEGRERYSWGGAAPPH